MVTQNAILVRAEVHVLIHATKEETIQQYLKMLKLDAKQLAILNNLRTMAGNKTINY